MTLQVGMTPLMLACRLGHESMVDMLVSVFGAEIDPADKVKPYRGNNATNAEWITHPTTYFFSNPFAPPVSTTCCESFCFSCFKP